MICPKCKGVKDGTGLDACYCPESVGHDDCDGCNGYDESCGGCAGHKGTPKKAPKPKRDPKEECRNCGIRGGHDQGCGSFDPDIDWQETECPTCGKKYWPNDPRWTEHQDGTCCDPCSGCADCD